MKRWLLRKRGSRGRGWWERFDEGNSASAAAGIDGSPILSDFGENIYVLDGTLSHISHKTFFRRVREREGERVEINFQARVRRSFIVNCILCIRLCLK